MQARERNITSFVYYKRQRESTNRPAGQLKWSCIRPASAQISCFVLRRTTKCRNFSSKIAMGVDTQKKVDWSSDRHRKACNWNEKILPQAKKNDARDEKAGRLASRKAEQSIHGRSWGIVQSISIRQLVMSNGQIKRTDHHCGYDLQLDRITRPEATWQWTVNSEIGWACSSPWKDGCISARQCSTVVVQKRPSTRHFVYEATYL
jgi:hypothetical protein